MFTLCRLPCRFLQVHPACVEDERLLVGIVAFLNAYFRQMHAESPLAPEDKDLRWILELLLNQVRIINTYTLTSVFLEGFWLEGIGEKTQSGKRKWLWVWCMVSCTGACFGLLVSESFYQASNQSLRKSHVLREAKFYSIIMTEKKSVMRNHLKSQQRLFHELST